MPTSALKTFVVDKFKGLNLSTAESDIDPAYATWCNNLEVTQSGDLRVRNGFQTWGTSTTTNPTRFLNYRPGIGRLQGIGMGEVSYWNLTTGAKIVPGGAPTWAATSVSPPAYFGVPAGNMYTFIASVNAGAGVQLRRVEDVSAAVQTAGNSTVACKPQFVCVWPGQNRLAQIGFFAAADSPSGANGGPSTIFFSDALAPETYTAVNFVQLDTGDSERFQGAVGYQNQLFVFKSSKMYVFYGTSPDDDGTLSFDYKTIPLPDAIVPTLEPTDWTPISVGPDGVYIVCATGLWKTTGSTPVRVPTTIEQVFANTDDTTSILQDAPGQFRTGWAGAKYYVTYVAFGASPATVCFVYDKIHDFWSTMTVGAGIETSPPLLFTAGGAYIAGTIFMGIRNVSGGTHEIWSSDMTKVIDTGTTRVAWLYISGYNAFDGPGEKRLRYVDIWATPQPAVSVTARGRRSGSVSSQASSAAISNVGSKDNQRYRLGLGGRQFQLLLQDTSAQIPTTKPVIKRIEYRYSDGSSV